MNMHNISNLDNNIWIISDGYKCQNIIQEIEKWILLVLSFAIQNTQNSKTNNT